MDILLVKNRTSCFKIAVPDNASMVEKTVSEELSEYMKKASGAEAEIISESKACGTTVYIGHTNYAEEKGIKGSSKENWIIAAVDGNIVLTGGLSAEDRGVAYSVYHFLEDFLDVHWWNTFEEYVPEISDFKVDGNTYINKTPAVPYRKIIEIFSHKDFVCQARNRMNIIGDDDIEEDGFREDVKLRGGAIYMGPPHHVHSLPKYFPVDEYFDEHPEWWAFNEALNKRINFGQLCLSNEEFYQTMLSKLLDNIEKENKRCEEAGREKPYFYSVSFADEQYMCECLKCKEIIKKAGRSGYALKFVNRLARDVAKIYPDVFLETLAYARYIEPPLDGTAPEANVIIRYADMYQDCLHDLNYPTNLEPFSRMERIKKWYNLCKKNNSPLFIWDYVLNFFPHCPMPQVFRIINNVKKTYQMGITGYLVENEMSHPRDFWALDQWVLNRIIEDPDLDEETLINTFITKYYGAAGSFIKEYLYLAHQAAEETGFILICDEPTGNWSYVTLELAEKGMELLDKALEKVRGDKILENRVQMVRGGMLKTIAVRYFEFKKIKEASGEEFKFDRRKVVQEIVSGLNEFRNTYAYFSDGSVAHQGLISGADRDIKVFSNLAEKTDEKFPLPEELKDVACENITDVYAKDVIRFIYGEKGVSITEDRDALVDKVLKLSYDEMNVGHKTLYRVTQADDPTPQPISFYIKRKNVFETVFEYKIDMYKKDLVADKYHLYKIEGVKGVSPESNLGLYIVRQRDLAINLSEICRTMPFKECDIYISAKFTGEFYNGKKGDENALYIERIIVVKTK